MTAPDLLPYVPRSFAAGTTVKFHRAFSNYSSADGYSYDIFFVGLASFHPGSGGTVTATADGGWDITIPAAMTAALLKCTLRYQERVSKASEVFEVGSGSCDLLANLATATTAQTWEETTLALLETAIAGKIPSGMETYQIAGRAMKSYSITELMEIHGRLKSIVQRQRGKGRLGQKILVEFGNPTTGGDNSGIDSFIFPR